MEEESVTDLSYLREVAMGDEEIMVETVRAFVAETPNAIRNLKEQFANQNWEKLAAQAHKIKPNLEYMGMDRARELIQQIEQQAQSRSITEDLESQVDEFSTVCSTALEELSEKIEELETQ